MTLKTTSFFGGLKSFIREETGSDFGGRYFAKVLQLVIERDSRTLKAFFPKIKAQPAVTVKTEFSLPNGRRADLAILDAEDRLLALAEIKDKDHRLDGVGTQIGDYLAHVAKHDDVCFSLITKGAPWAKDLKLIRDRQDKRICHLRLHEIHKRLSKIRHKDIATEEFINFLKEEGMTWQQDIKLRPLLYFMKNTIGWKHVDGLGKLVSTATVFDANVMVGKAMGNLSLIAGDLHGDAPDSFSRRPKQGFRCSPWYNAKRAHYELKKRLNDGEDSAQISDKACVAGDLYIHNNAIIRDSESLELGFGWALYIDLTAKTLRIDRYADIWDYRTDDYAARNQKIEVISVKGKSKDKNNIYLPMGSQIGEYGKLKRLIIGAGEAFLKKHPQMSAKNRRALKKFVDALKA